MLLIFHYYSKSFMKMFSFVIMQHFVKSCQECKIFDESLLTFPMSPQKFLKCLKYKKSNLTENNLKSHPEFFFFSAVQNYTTFGMSQMSSLKS